MCGRYGFAPGEFREIKLRFNIGGDLPLFTVDGRLRRFQAGEQSAE